jgi:hypothetical protein
MNDPMPYKAAFSKGTQIKIADRSYLETFMTSWKYHHKLLPEQLEFADRLATVEDVSFYHGGDPLYKLADIPGLWHEQCLRLE